MTVYVSNAEKLDRLNIPDELRPLSLSIPSVRDTIETCVVIYAKGGVVSRIIHKKASYPITRIIPEFPSALKDTSKGGVKGATEKRRDIEKLINSKLKLREHIIDIQLKRELTGNVVVFFYPTFTKVVHCNKCGSEENFSESNVSIERNGTPRGKCRSCQSAELVLQDVKSTDMEDVSADNFIILDVNGIRIHENPITKKTKVYYVPPPNFQRLIQTRNKFIIETTPQIFIDAVTSKKAIDFDPGDVMVFGGLRISDITLKNTINRYSLPFFPRLITALPDIMGYLADRESDLMMSANIISPSEIIYPSQTSDEFSPVNVDLGLLREKIDEIFSSDDLKKGLGYSPIPLGKLLIGDSSLQMAQYVAQRKRTRLEEMVSSVGIPPELILGGMSIAATSVALRNIENEIYNDRTDLESYMNEFVIRKLVSQYNFPKLTLKFADLRSTDDVQRMRLMMELAEKGKIGWGKILGTLGEYSKPNMDEIEEDLMAEAELSKKRQKLMMMAQTEAELEAQRETMNLQIEMEKLTGGGGEGGPQSPGENAQADEQMVTAAQQILEQLVQMPPEQQEEILMELEQSNPELYNIVLQMYQEMEASGQSPAAPGQKAPEEGVPTPQQAGGAPQGEEAQTNQSQVVMDSLYRQAMNLGIPDQQIEDAVQIAFSLINLPEDQRYAALGALDQQYPQIAEAVRHLVEQGMFAMRAEDNLNTPLPEQREQTRENPI